MGSSAVRSHAQFAATRWSLVVAAGGGGEGVPRRALDELLGLYWFPLYAYVRQRGRTREEAEDTVQGFLGSLVAREDLAGLSPERGKFRSFLLAGLTHFLANERDHVGAKKRGGGVRTFSLDAMDAEARYALEPAEGATAERVFERRWALALLEHAVGLVAGQYAGQRALFEALKPVLTGEAGKSYGEIGASLGMTEGAVKVAAHRLRRRYRETLRGCIADTLAGGGAGVDGAAIDEEIGYLMRCL